MDVPSSWDALRKQARKLEAQLDEQMHSYPTTSKYTNARLGIVRRIRNGFTYFDSSSGNSSRSYSDTNFLLDMIEVQEFYRLRSSLKAKQEHASLLEDFREFDRTRLDLEDGVGSPEQALLKEHASINRSTGQMDSVISQAQATLGALVFQRSTFGGINSKLSNVSSRLPSV
ncbi:Golgi SNAP receptor complex member 1-1 [Citrus sinensis]|uniref:Golgi SNAP receptor complex member 1-1 n=1 Tax=Citrus sinensis TaxID=2711 RepID=A0ACB8JFN7_CITSI|nr:Golgi SNAP receptor complex member 1-1 [Citrus sinensis]